MTSQSLDDSGVSALPGDGFGDLVDNKEARVSLDA